MKLWLVDSLLVVLLWGMWGFFIKMATRSMNAPSILLASTIAEFLLLAICIPPVSKELNFEWTNIDFGFAFFSGFVMLAGVLLFYRAISIGKVTPIVLITACYPLITIILSSIVLKEPISTSNMIGAVLTISGVCLISS